MNLCDPSQHLTNSVSYICERYYNLSGKSLDENIQLIIRKCLESGIDADAISLKLTRLFDAKPDMALNPNFVAGVLLGMHRSQKGDYEEWAMTLLRIKHKLSGKYGFVEED